MTENSMGFILRLYILAAMVVGLFFWVLRPPNIPPAAQLREAASVAGFLLLIAVGAGVAAMATVQFWKNLFRPRSAFHQRELDIVFGREANGLLALVAGNTPGIVELLDSPTEVLMGQLRSAADYAVLRPKGLDGLLNALAGGGGKSAVDKYLNQLAPSKEMTSTDGFADDPQVEVRFHVEQRLNLLHIKLKEGWRRRVRLVAVCVAAAVGFVTVMLSKLQLTVELSVFIATVIWGGFFSWLARDLVALVERRRT